MFLINRPVTTVCIVRSLFVITVHSLVGHHEGLGGSLLREDAVVHGDHLPDRVAGVVGDAEVLHARRVALRKDDETLQLRVLHQGLPVARTTHYVSEMLLI